MAAVGVSAKCDIMFSCLIAERAQIYKSADTEGRTGLMFVEKLIEMCFLLRLTLELN